MYTDPLHDDTVNAVIALLTHSKGADLLEVNEFVRKLGGNKGRCFTRESRFHFCSRENFWLKITDSGEIHGSRYPRARSARDHAPASCGAVKAMISLKRLALVVGLIGLAQASRADPVCDFEGKCYPAEAPHQTYHMDPTNPDLETPPPAPEYPAPSAVQGRTIVVQPNACHLFRMRSVPDIAPLIVEICPVPADEERAIRERASGAVGADVGR
jgi:hypothetical protein